MFDNVQHLQSIVKKESASEANLLFRLYIAHVFDFIDFFIILSGNLVWLFSSHTFFIATKLFGMSAIELFSILSSDLSWI